MIGRGRAKHLLPPTISSDGYETGELTLTATPCCRPAYLLNLTFIVTVLFDNQAPQYAAGLLRRSFHCNTPEKLRDSGDDEMELKQVVVRVG